MFHGLEIMTFQITTHLLNYIILYTHKFEQANRICNKGRQHKYLTVPKSSLFLHWTLRWLEQGAEAEFCGLNYPNLTRPVRGLAGLILSDGRIIHVKINQDIIHKLTLHFYQRHVIMWFILRLIHYLLEKMYKTKRWWKHFMLAQDFRLMISLSFR